MASSPDYDAGATSAYTVRETAAYYAAKIERIADEQQRDKRIRLSERVSMDSIRAFLDRIARDDLGAFRLDEDTAPLPPDVGAS